MPADQRSTGRNKGVERSIDDLKLVSIRYGASKAVRLPCTVCDDTENPRSTDGTEPIKQVLNQMSQAVRRTARIAARRRIVQ